MKPRIKNHFRAHQLSIWLRLIPELHRTGMEDVITRHNLFKNHDDMDLYDGPVKLDSLSRLTFLEETIKQRRGNGTANEYSLLNVNGNEKKILSSVARLLLLPFCRAHLARFHLIAFDFYWFHNARQTDRHRFDPIFFSFFAFRLRFHCLGSTFRCHVLAIYTFRLAHFVVVADDTVLKRFYFSHWRFQTKIGIKLCLSIPFRAIGACHELRTSNRKGRTTNKSFSAKPLEMILPLVTKARNMM